MKKAHYDSTSKELLGFYDTELHKTIPSPSIEITENTWQDSLKNGFNCVNVESKTLFLKDFRTQAELDEEALQTSISEAQTLLKDTDFYVIRKMEESIEIPAEIVTARANAKTVLRDNNISYTLGV